MLQFPYRFLDVTYEGMASQEVGILPGILQGDTGYGYRPYGPIASRQQASTEGSWKTEEEFPRCRTARSFLYGDMHTHSFCRKARIQDMELRMEFLSFLKGIPCKAYPGWRVHGASGSQRVFHGRMIAAKAPELYFHI